MRRDRGCARPAELIFVVVSLNIGSALAAWSVGAPPWAGMVLSLGGGLLLLAAWALLFAAVDRLFVPMRIRRAMSRIRDLDEREAEDAEFDAAFARLRALHGRHMVPMIREAMRDDALKSRRWFVDLLKDRRWCAEARALLRELAEDWSDPISERARAAL